MNAKAGRGMNAQARGVLRDDNPFAEERAAYAYAVVYEVLYGTQADPWSGKIGTRLNCV